MSIISNMLKVYSTWGKNSDVASSGWKEYWTYICTALDGSWGSVTLDNVTVFYKGSTCNWQTQPFVASSSIKIIAPVQCNTPYSIMIMNLTSGTVSCKEMTSSEITIALTSTNKYQIISSSFIPKV